MARAQRHFLPGHLWHITHRCHKREFLLKFARDRARYLQHLYQARKKFGLSVLNYMVTCNHVHLLVGDNGCHQTIPRSMQLVAGRVAQEYNKRKHRKGAFWEDRYHATAIEGNEHLLRCMIYIDLNMVRANAVSHPNMWKQSGYNEIQHPRQRYRIIDRELLKTTLRLESSQLLGPFLANRVGEAMASEEGARDEVWTQSIAVGGRKYVESIKELLGSRAKGRKITQEDGSSLLREPSSAYRVLFGAKKGSLSMENGTNLDENSLLSMG